MVLEIDGGQHFEKENEIKDLERDNDLKNLGLKVLRFTNLEVLKNMQGVIDKIIETIEEEIPLNPPLEKGENKNKTNQSQPNPHFSKGENKTNQF